MKHILYFLSILLSLSFCLTSCEQNNQPEEEQEDHQPKYPSSFKLAGKVYVGTSKTVDGLKSDSYEVFSFTEDSVKYYQTENKDLSPTGVYYRNSTYRLNYPTIYIIDSPEDLVVNMLDTITLELYGNTYYLR